MEIFKQIGIRNKKLSDADILKALKKLRPNCLVTVVSRTSKHTQNKFVDFKPF